MNITRTAYVTRTKMAAATAALVTAGLLLTACGGAGGTDADVEKTDPTPTKTQEAASPTVYDFDNVRVASTEDQIPFTADGESITIKPSEELLAAMPDGARQTIDHYTISAKAFDTGICRLDVEIEFVHNGKEALSAPHPMSGETPTTHIMGGITKGYHFNEKALVDKLPADDELENKGFYFTKDFSQATFVDYCGEDNDDQITYLSFPTYQKIDDNEIDNFAVASIAVIQGGQSGTDGVTVVITGETLADVSPTGKWEKAEV